MSITTRFAPSPTGHLHIGGVRTALFAWLLARQQADGKFLLRIEDTDRERSTQESVDAILEAFAWLELNYDEEPIYQTDRYDRYKEVCDSLLAQGKAYKCYCSKERLQDLREQQMAAKQKPRYDGHCRDMAEQSDKPYVVRFKNPTEGAVEFDDAVRGRVVFQNSELDDLIIYRSDGNPTYNFVVVVDDCDMKITHVLRGDDHVNNTPRQINIMKALGFKPPKFAHVPMILGPDGQRLSKRHGAVSVMQFHQDGYLKEAVLNYLVRLGWSQGDKEIFSLDEMKQLFSLKKLNGSPATFDYEKLKWLNQHYIKEMNLSELEQRMSPFVGSLDLGNGPKLSDVLALMRERSKTLVELAKSCHYFYCDSVNVEQDQVESLFTPEATEAVKTVCAGLESLNDWDADQINAVIKQALEKHVLKMKVLAMPLRLAVTGGTNSPSIAHVIFLLGKRRVVSRIHSVLDSL